MTVLKIYYLEDNKETDPVSTLEDGEHIIGRGQILNCNDKRVSRKHALINIQKDRVFIKSVHINPCFFKAANGNNIVILKKDESLTLNDGDNFALLADSYWFRVKILIQSNSDMQVDNVQDPIDNTEGVNDSSILVSNSSKRCYTDDNSSELCKRTKLSNENELVDINSSITLSPSPKEVPVEKIHESSPPHEPSDDLDELLSSSSNVNVTDADTKVLLDNLENIIEEDKAAAVKEEISESEGSVDFLEIATSEGNVKTDDEAVSTTIRIDENDSVEVKTEDVDAKVKVEHNNTEKEIEGNNTNANDPSGSSDTNNQQQTKKREQCWYGSTCYRKNVAHRAIFSHPGDPDYDDPADIRPDCPFGRACYRTNLDHRKQYKHSSKPAPKPRPVTPNENANSIAIESSDSETDNNDATERKRKVTKVKKNYNESPIEDYDYNDPFIDDGSSDEYQISTDGEDGSTDWEDSEKVVDESQGTYRLLKEAKRFTKKQK